MEQFFADMDDDGVIETVAEPLDTNMDGTVDTIVAVSDLSGDGAFDTVTQLTDFDQDGLVDAEVSLIDTDGDGYVDERLEYSYSPEQGTDPYVTPYQPAPDPVPDNGAVQDLPNFDPTMDGPGVTGDPAGELAFWHQQTYDDTCAVAAQEFVLESLTGRDFSEDALRQEAIDNGWFTPGGGTPLEATGSLLEAHGVDVERQYGGTLDDLGALLERGHKVIVGVDSDEIWTPGRDPRQDDLLGDVPGYPGQSPDHAVEVIGIDRSDPGNPMVILNDPGHPDGQGLMVPADEFVDAWADSDHYMVYTTGYATAATRTV